MAAVACVFSKVSSLADLMDAVSEEIAQVPHFFFKSASVGVWVAGGFEEERVSASLANVFGVAVAFRQFDVAVVTEKAGHGVADASRGTILLKERRAATAAIEAFLNLAEHSVVHRVAEKLAGQLRQKATKKNRSARGFRREPTQCVCFHGFPLGGAIATESSGGGRSPLRHRLSGRVRERPFCFRLRLVRQVVHVVQIALNQPRTGQEKQPPKTNAR